MFLFDRPPVVIEFGHSVVRVGFAGDAAPRLELPTPAFLLESLYGREEKEDGALNIDVSKFLAALLVNELCIKPTEHKALLIEGPVMPLHLQQAVNTTLTKELRCPSVVWTRHPAASVFASAAVASLPLSLTGLVVDVGARDTRVTTVLHGHTLAEESRVNAFGSRFIESCSGLLLTEALGRWLQEAPSTGSSSLASVLVAPAGGAIGASNLKGGLPALHSSLPAFIASGGRSTEESSSTSSAGLSLSSFPALPSSVDASMEASAEGKEAEEKNSFRQWVVDYDKPRADDPQQLGEEGKSGEKKRKPAGGGGKNKGFISAGDRWLWLLSQCAEGSLSSTLSRADVVSALNHLCRDRHGIAGQLLDLAASYSRGQASKVYSALQRELEGRNKGAAAEASSSPSAAIPIPAPLLSALRKAAKAVESTFPSLPTPPPAVSAAAETAAASSASSPARQELALGTPEISALSSAFRSVFFPEQLELPTPELSSSALAGERTALRFVLSVLSSLSRLLHRYCVGIAPERPLQLDIAQALVKSPVDARRAVAGNVVFCGGLASAKGFVGSTLALLRKLVLDSKGALACLRPLVDGGEAAMGCGALSLGNSHPPAVTAFAGASILAATAASVNVPVPMSLLVGASFSSSTPTVGGSLASASTASAVPAYAQLTLDRGGRVATGTSTTTSSAGLLPRSPRAATSIPAVLVDAFSASSLTALAVAPSPAPAPAAAPAADVGKASQLLPANEGIGTAASVGAPAPSTGASSIAARLAKAQAMMAGAQGAGKKK